MKTQTAHIASTPEKPYAVQLTQHGWGTNLACFATFAESRAFAEHEWEVNRDHQDFTRGGNDRAEWSVSLDRHDADGELIDSETVWSAKADERL